MGFTGGAHGLAVLAALAIGISPVAPRRLVPGAPDAPGAEPARGRFLVAQRGLPGPFAQSVVLLLEHGPGGSLGLVVNRPTALPLAALLPILPAKQRETDPADRASGTSPAVA